MTNKVIPVRFFAATDITTRNIFRFAESSIFNITVQVCVPMRHTGVKTQG